MTPRLSVVTFIAQVVGQVQTDTYAKGTSVFLTAESCLLCSVCHSVKALHSAVSWVLTKAPGERHFLLAVRPLGCDTVWSGGNTADILKERTGAVFRAERLIFLYLRWK